MSAVGSDGAWDGERELAPVAQDVTTEKLEELKGALRQELPKWVKDVRFRWSVDREGEPVLLAFLAVDPGETAVKDGRKLWEARQVVARTYANRSVDYWPHVRFEDVEG